MAESIPSIGQRVYFGHLNVDGERTGTITACARVAADLPRQPRWVCDVAVDFLSADGPQNQPGKVVSSCLWFTAKPDVIPASHMQYCRPLED